MTVKLWFKLLLRADPHKIDFANYFFTFWFIFALTKKFVNRFCTLLAIVAKFHVQDHGHLCSLNIQTLFFKKKAYFSNFWIMGKNVARGLKNNIIFILNKVRLNFLINRTFLPSGVSRAFGAAPQRMRFYTCQCASNFVKNSFRTQSKVWPTECHQLIEKILIRAKAAHIER